MATIDTELKDKAFNLYLEAKGKITCKEVGLALGIKPDTVVKWKNRYNWDRLVGNGSGAPLGNQNAKGHNGGKVKQIYNRVINQKYIALLPESVGKMLKKIQEDDPAERYWRAICIQEQRIIAILKYMSVDDDTEDDREVIGDSDKGTAYRHVFVWEKMAAQQDALTKAYKVLMKLMKDHDDYVNKNWELCNKEQHLRVDQMKVKLEHKIRMDIEHQLLEREKFEHKMVQDRNKAW